MIELVCLLDGWEFCIFGIVFKFLVMLGSIEWFGVVFGEYIDEVLVWFGYFGEKIVELWVVGVV